MAAAEAAVPHSDFKRVGRNGKPVQEPTGLETIKGSIPYDVNGIVFARAAGALQIDLAVVISAVAFINIALSKVAHHVLSTQ